MRTPIRNPPDPMYAELEVHRTMIRDRVRTEACHRDMLPDPDASVTSIAKLLGISPGTLYNHIPDLRELRADGRLQHQVTAAAAS